MTKTEPEAAYPTPTERLPYHNPKLELFGSLEELTKTVATGGDPDGNIGILNAILRTAILL